MIRWGIFSAGEGTSCLHNKTHSKGMADETPLVLGDAAATVPSPAAEPQVPAPSEPLPAAGDAAVGDAAAGADGAADEEPPEPILPGSAHPYLKLVKEAKKVGENPITYGADLLASTRRPQNVMSGFGSGARTFVKCAGLGAATMVSTPFAATYTAASTGWKEGFGVLAAGTASAAALTAVAVAVPTVQIGRGIYNTPDAISGMAGGMDWDEDARAWVPPIPVTLLESMDDLEKLVQSESARTKTRGPVKETELYDLLGVAAHADAAAIKKAYRKTALKLHPDKNVDDPNATERFQDVGKAYQILSDDRLRAAYDAGGSEATEDNALIDSTQLYEIFFGSEALEPAVGELLLLKCAGTVLEMHQSGDLEEVQKKLGADDLDKFVGDLDDWQLRRQAQVALNLAERLDAVPTRWATAEAELAAAEAAAQDNAQPEPEPAGEGEDAAAAAPALLLGAAAMQAFETDARAEADKMANSPYGATLLHAIGYVYTEKAEEWKAKRWGLLGAASQAMGGIRSTWHDWETYYETTASTVRAAGAMQGTGNGLGVQASEGIVHAAEALVKLVVMDVEHTLGVASDWVLGDTGAADDALVARTTALARLGKIYIQAADAIGGEPARRKWRADTLRSAGGGGNDPAASLEGLLSGLQLRTAACAEIRDAMMVRARDGKQWTVYQIGCYDDDGDWAVGKRYSDFETLRDFLESQGVETHTPFPAKTIFSSSASESTVVERKGGLHAWLYALLEQHSDNKAVQMFLRDDGTGRTLTMRPLLEDLIPMNTPVAVKGLENAAQHNGKTGHVLGFDLQKQRYVVKLTGGPGGEVVEGKLAVQGKNLLPGLATADGDGKFFIPPFVETEAMVWRLGNMRSLLGQMFGGAAVCSEAFDCKDERWCLRLALMPSSDLGILTKQSKPDAEAEGLLAKLEALGADEQGEGGSEAGAGGDEGEDEDEEEEEEGEEERLWLVASLKFMGEHKVEGTYTVTLEGGDGAVISAGGSAADSPDTVGGGAAMVKFDTPSRDNYSIAGGFTDGSRVVLGTIDASAAALCDVLEAEGDNTLRMKLSLELSTTADSSSDEAAAAVESARQARLAQLVGAEEVAAAAGAAEPTVRIHHPHNARILSWCSGQPGFALWDYGRTRRCSRQRPSFHTHSIGVNASGFDFSDFRRSLCFVLQAAEVVKQTAALTRLQNLLGIVDISEELDSLEPTMKAHKARQQAARGDESANVEGAAAAPAVDGATQSSL